MINTSNNTLKNSLRNSLKNKLYLVLLSAAVLLTPLFHSACSSTETESIASITAKKSTFEITIPAFGELKAVKSTPINVPNHLRGRQTISWLAPENSHVKKDEVVIRLDSSSYLDSIRDEEFKIAKFDLEIQQKKRQLDKEKSELLSQLDITSIEKELTEVYAARDETLYPKHKIIEDQLDLDYLKQKTRHYNQKKNKLEKKAQAELQLLYAKKKTCQVKVDQFQKALDSLEIKAPHDGLFIYHTQWREKTRVGQSVYRGRKLAELPDTSEMEAILQVLESEAAGLKKDLPVSITMDSAPDFVFYGKIKNMASIAKSLERESPLKYFEVKVKLNATKTALMKPGNQVNAIIMVKRQDDVIAVPNQALVYIDGKPHLNIKSSSSFDSRQVEIGERSLTQTVITKGLDPGEFVLLGNPTASQSPSNPRKTGN